MNSLMVHPQLSPKRFPTHYALMGAGSHDWIVRWWLLVLPGNFLLVWSVWMAVSSDLLVSSLRSHSHVMLGLCDPTPTTVPSIGNLL